MQEGFAELTGNMANAISEASKSAKVSNKICKRRKLIQMYTQNWLAYQHINERQTARGNTQER